MQVALSFRFPHYARDVVVQVFVPLPEQRPHTVANFIFAATGQLPPADTLTALQLDMPGALPITVHDAAAARAGGLVPFADTAIVRVEKGSMVEMGSSTTKTIFGGFLPDEPVTLPPGPVHGSLASSMMRRPAGTILCGNMGMPSSQGSRYYILLTAAGDPARTTEQREELESYAPLGIISSGLETLIAASQATPVHPRTLAPTKKVELVGCHIEFDHRGLLRKRREAGGLGAHAVAGGDEAASAMPRARVAGRTRGRDDEESAEVRNAVMAAVSADDGEEEGFFKVNVHYPERSARAAGASGNAKRRRAEALTLDEDGQTVLRTTAIHLENGVPVRSEEGGPQFDFFTAQDASFWNDIDLIKDQQALRDNHRKHRRGKGPASSARQKPTAGSLGGKKKGSTAGASVLGKTSSRKTKRAPGKRY